MTAIVWTKEVIATKLAESDAWLMRGVIAIYACQTMDEQHNEHTRELNGIGFNGADAKLLSSFAKQIQSRGFLSTKQKEYARKKMKKYAGQLARIANSR